MMPSPVTRHPSPGLQNAARHVFNGAAGMAVVLWAAACGAQQVSSGELIAKAAEYDGKTVTFRGEAIGDVMLRGDYAWVNVSDGRNAVGIWMPAALARTIAQTGAYLVRGDTIEVRGVFHRSCLEHGGDLDIHAEAMTKVVPGVKMPEEPVTAKAKTALGLAMILGAVWILNTFKKRYIPRFRR